MELDNIHKKLNFFKSYYIFDENSLDDKWHYKYDKYASEHGFALWSWKPYVIYNALSQINDGDCLFYADGGCDFGNSINNDFFNDLKFHINNTSKCVLPIGIEPCLHAKYPNYIIIRKQILEKFNLMCDRFFLLDWLHFEAGVLIIIKNSNSMKFIESWKEFFDKYFEDTIYSKFTDKNGQFNGFVHNGSD